MRDKDNLRHYTFIRMRFWSFYGTEVGRWDPPLVRRIEPLLYEKILH